MTKAANGQARLIPYPVIEAAVSGDADAVNQVIRHYSGYIATLCKRTGRDERAISVRMWMKNCVNAWRRS